jgi:hypothetical protein
MGGDDLARNIQAETGVLAEIFLFGPVRVKTIENFLKMLFRDARPFILDGDLDLLRLPVQAAYDPDRAIGGRERNGIVEQIVDDLA